MTDRRLESWKAIARHFGKSERTVRRWEAEEGLPVRRHMHKAQGSVFAWESELAAWQRGRSVAQPAPPPTERTTARSVVVSPFQFLGGDPANAYLAVGFTDELIADLARLGDMRVISRTSSFALADRSLSAGEIRKLLGVDLLIEGTVLQSGARLRISLSLVDTAQDRSLWSHGITCDVDDIFEAQAGLARAAAEALQQQLTERGSAALSSRLKRDRRIWSTLVRARAEALRWRHASIENAIRLIEAGLQEFGADPELVAASGRYHLYLRETGADMSERPLRAARDALQTLREIAPDAAQTHHLAGWTAYQHGQPGAAIHALRQAVARDPDDPDAMALLAYCYLLSGYDTAAQPLIARLLLVDPLTPLNHSLAACADLFAGRFGPAIEGYARMCELDPASKIAQLFHVMALALAGEGAAALRIVDHVAASPEAGPVDRLLHAFGQAVSGRPIPPVDHVDAAIGASTVDMFPRLMAQACGLAGDRQAALRWLAIAVARGFAHDRFVATHDPSFAGLGGDPAFAHLLDEMRRKAAAVQDLATPEVSRRPAAV
jgi:TolB-like protein